MTLPWLRRQQCVDDVRQLLHFVVRQLHHQRRDAAAPELVCDLHDAVLAGRAVSSVP